MDGIKRSFIFICTGSDCKKNGSKKLIKSLSAHLKERKEKNRCLVIKTKCMDFCKKGPNVVVNNRLLHKVDPDNPGQVLKEL